MATNIIANALISVEFLPDHTPVISSRSMALHFQKKHKHILEEIKKIQSITPQSFHGPNFRPTFATVAMPNNATRKDPAFLLTRDAFSLLAMGFTGKAAVLWKLRYIEAFNALEKAVLENAASLAHESGYVQGVDAGRAERPALLAAAEKKGVLQGLRMRRDNIGIAAKAAAYRAKGLSVQETARLLKMPYSTLRELLRRAAALAKAVA